MAIQVSVIGSGAQHERRAEEVGRLLAERGCTVVTGGGDEASSLARGEKKRTSGSIT
jgi:predicted Rossmann-fold nucleotide-binding protein